jgi:hypothetical protein
MTTTRLLAAAALLALAGCADGTPKVYPVTGKVTLSGGDLSKLAGHHVEAALEGDPNVRAAGIIAADGSFALETLYNGKILKGAPEGKYKVRILPADEDDDGKKLKKPPVAKKHLTFDASGLSLQVPPPGEVTLELSPR